MSIHVTKLVDDDGKQIGDGNAVLRILAMKGRQLLPAAKLCGGQEVTVRLTRWQTVKDKHAKVMTGILPTTDLNLNKPLYWAELVSP
jgi:hypothetical protein